MVGQQNEPLVPAHHYPTCTWSLCLFATRIVLPPSVDVGTCIEGMFEHHLERGSIGAAPDQFPFAQTLSHADAELDLVGSQIAYQAA